MRIEPFWKLQTTEEMQFVRQILVDRFPETYQRLSDSLDFVDPFEIYQPGNPGNPGNPGDYSDVVREVVVLPAPVGGDLSALDEEGLSAILREGLTRCFEDQLDEGRFARLIDRLSDSQNIPETSPAPSNSSTAGVFD